MLDLTTIDFSNIQVLREWRNIDIFAISEENKFILIIENKVPSKESSHQIKKYLDIVQSEYPSYRKLGISTF